MNTLTKSRAVLLGMMTLFSQTILASGFQSHEQSAARFGAANAGTGVMRDASVAFFNPAAMTQFKRPILSASGILVAPDFHYRVIQATDFAGNPITGSTKDPGQSELLPAGYYIQPINEHWVFGLSMTVPFGLSTDYGEDSIARYFATKSKTEVINIAPSIAYKWNDSLSLGAGVDVQWFQAELNQAFDFGSFVPGKGDVFVRNKASDWSGGWHMGVFYQASPATRLGLAYRSSVHHTLHGDSRVLNVPSDPLSQFNAGFLGLRASDVMANIDLPGHLTFSVAHEVNDKWTVMADVQYVHWSTLKNITLSFSGNPDNIMPEPNHLAPVVLDLDYHDTWRVSVGQEYQVHPQVLLRAGVAYEQTPAHSDKQIVRLPDSDRYWLTLGAGFNWRKHWLLDVAYAHIFFADHTLTQSTNTGIGTALFNARYSSSSANLFGAQLSYQFA